MGAHRQQRKQVVECKNPAAEVNIAQTTQTDD